MKPDALNAEVDRLNRSRGGFSYRIMLGGLIAVHGREAVVQAMIGSWSGNVVSIAAAPGWCRWSGQDNDNRRIG
jgi:hypothetical protein